MNDSDLPGFDPAVIAIDGLVAADLGILEIYRLLFVDEELDIVFERALIALQGEDVIGFLVDDRLSDFALATHRVDGDHRPLDRQHAQQLGNGDDLVGFFPDLDLTENETLAPAKADTMWIGPLGFFFFLEVFEPDLRGVLPSMAITSAETPVCAATQATKQRSNGSGSSVARMSPKWSCAGVPSSKGRKRLRNASFSRPNLAMSVIVSDPATMASRHNSKISSSGYFTLPLCRTSGNSLKRAYPVNAHTHYM